MATDKNMTGLYDGTPQARTHGKGHLPNPTYPNPQEHAKARSGMNMSAGKGSGSQKLGTGTPAGAGGITNAPGKGPGTPMGMTGGKAKGLAQPFNNKGTRKG